MTNNKHVLSWIDEMAKLVNPTEIVWIDGSEEQAEALRAEACSTGEMIKLNQDLLPGCYLHRTAVNDVARVEGRTFICTRKKEDAGNINNWMDPKECYETLSKYYKNAYAGKKMYVIPYSMGVVGSDFAKIGIELTDSIYVVLNMLIMTRAGAHVLEAMGDSPTSLRVCTQRQISMKRTVISATSRKTTPSGLSTPATAETFCSAKSALHSALRPTSARRKAGWLSIC